ncbi:hypothetical protein ES705_06983 [subsurface metagenome]
MRLSNLILEIAENSIKFQNENGSFLPGHNGPYYDSETPVRNSGHWLITFSKCYKLTNKSKYRDKAYQVAEYLTSEYARPNGYSFYHRNKKGKDKCNGLIGQAWTIEALVEATKILEDNKYSLLAEEVFFQHKFNEECGLWNRLGIDGQILPIDSAFNHQLWFAVCASLIKSKRSNEILRRIKKFINMLPQNLTTLENGIIFHPIEWLSKDNSINCNMENTILVKKVKNYLKTSRNFILNKRILTEEEIYDKEIYKSIGYHSFNMYAFSILKSQLPNNAIWQSDLMERSIKFLLSNEYINLLENNKYAFPYNPPGFEVPYSLYILKKMKRKEFIGISKYWINRQFDECFNKKSFMMDRNTKDFLTHTARIYELTRLPDSILKEILINY